MDFPLQGQSPGTPRGMGKEDLVLLASVTSSWTPKVSDNSPPPELLLPENRHRYLHYLLEVQFPAVRDLVGKLLEGAYFLLDPASVSFRLMRRLVVEADEYNENSPYWEWVRSVAALAIHEVVVGAQGPFDEAEEVNEEDSVNEALRCLFNRLPLEERRALYLVAVLGHSIEDAAGIAGVEAERIRHDAREGLRKLDAGLNGKKERGATDGGI